MFGLEDELMDEIIELKKKNKMLKEEVKQLTEERNTLSKVISKMMQKELRKVK